MEDKVLNVRTVTNYEYRSVHVSAKKETISLNSARLYSFPRPQCTLPKAFLYLFFLEYPNMKERGFPPQRSLQATRPAPSPRKLPGR